jgi:predicted PurR-regulated permease PerM
VQKILNSGPVGQYILARLKNADISVTGVFGAFLTTTVGVIEAAIIIVISAAYLASDPEVYREGFVQFFSNRYQDWTRETLLDLGAALRYWLLGQFVQMAIIGL